MNKHDKTLQKLLSGTADASLVFEDVLGLLAHKGFSLRHGKGSHVIATKPGLQERITLQADGPKAKSYQVRQIRAIFLNHPELLP